MNRMLHIFKSIFPALAMAFFLNACRRSQLGLSAHAVKSIRQSRDHQRWRAFSGSGRQTSGLSGFSLVEHGENAFLARLAMADLAEKTWTRSITSGIQTPPAGS